MLATFVQKRKQLTDISKKSVECANGPLLETRVAPRLAHHSCSHPRLGEVARPLTTRPRRCLAPPPPSRRPLPDPRAAVPPNILAHKNGSAPRTAKARTSWRGHPLKASVAVTATAGDAQDKRERTFDKQRVLPRLCSATPSVCVSLVCLLLDSSWVLYIILLHLFDVFPCGRSLESPLTLLTGGGADCGMRDANRRAPAGSGVPGACRGHHPMGPAAGRGRELHRVSRGVEGYGSKDAFVHVGNLYALHHSTSQREHSPPMRATCCGDRINPEDLNS